MPSWPRRRVEEPVSSTAHDLFTPSVCILPAVHIAMYAIAHTQPSTSPSSELMWDNGCSDKTISGTVTIPEGADSHWSPSMLLATSVGASLLSTFLSLSQRVHLPLLGLSTHQSIELDAQSDVPAVIVTACITVPTKQAGADAHTVWRRTLREAPILKVLSCRVTAESSIVIGGDDAQRGKGP